MTHLNDVSRAVGRTDSIYHPLLGHELVTRCLRFLFRRHIGCCHLAAGHFGSGYSLRNQVSWATLSLPGRGVHAASSPQTPRARSSLDGAHNCLERQCTGRPRTVESIAGHTLRRDGVHIQSSRVCAQLGVRCQVARARHGRCVATHGYPRLFLRFLQRQSEEKRCRRASDQANNTILGYRSTLPRSL